jgi:hypothetical protein
LEVISKKEVITMRQTAHKAVMLRLDPEVHEAIAAVAKAEKRSITAQVELVLERYLTGLETDPELAKVLPKIEPLVLV